MGRTAAAAAWPGLASHVSYVMLLSAARFYAPDCSCACVWWVQLGLQHGLEPLSPVDDAGCFTSEAGAEFEGLSVLAEGNDAVVQALDSSGALLKVITPPSSCCWT